MEDRYRYERKFYLTMLEREQVLSILRRHPQAFVEAYPPRYVNNIYLDTPWLSNYEANVAGLAERLKVRVRWYHDFYADVEDGILEFKIKRGLVGMKHSFAFPRFMMDDQFSGRAFERLLRIDLLEPQAEEKLIGYQPCLINRYLRRYYASRDGRFRVTVDEELTYHPVKRFRNRFISEYRDPQALVVELKYETAHEMHAHRVASWFPFRPTRSSKYAMGLEVLYS
jgi:hypothetical protein